MPATAGSSYSATLPPFMSVLSEGRAFNHASMTSDYASGNAIAPPSRARPSVAATHAILPPSSSSTSSSASSPRAALASAHARLRDDRRGSAATAPSLSTESSPTTTISTVDSCIPDASPSSSPESPPSTVPPASLHLSRMVSGVSPTSDSSASASVSDSTSPGGSPSERDASSRRARNTKNLFINTAGISTQRAAITSTSASVSSALANAVDCTPTSSPPVGASSVGRSASLVSSSDRSLNPPPRACSAPATPSLAPALPVPRRSRLALTLATTSPDGSAAGGVPPTPSRLAAPPLTVRHRGGGSEGSVPLDPVPETPRHAPLSSLRERDLHSGRALFSPVAAPPGGMQLPPVGWNIDPTLPTPGMGPEGGMTFGAGSHPTSPAPVNPPSLPVSPAGKSGRPALNLARPTFDAPGSSTVVQHTVNHVPSTPLHDLPLSREAKSPGYPDGPVCIYPQVYLYHQPTADEARTFDVIVNVAREVANPFLPAPDEAEEGLDSKKPGYVDASIQCNLIGGPLPSLRGDAPIDMRVEAATPAVPAHLEYIHLPWEHNTKVYEEWLRVCELIDARVQQGKRVLIHCQLGVSRSASLVVAYGIFKNPSLSPDEAREQAKRQSRWIDLNMHFMYELGDFKKLLAKKRPATHGAAALRRPATGGAMPGGLLRTKTDSILMSTSHTREGSLGRIRDDLTIEEEQSPARRASTPVAQHCAAVPPPPVSSTIETAPPPVWRSDADDESAPSTLTARPAGPSTVKDAVLAVAPPATAIAVENTASDRTGLPAPNLSIPMNAPMRRTLRPMPSLPVGLNSMSQLGSEAGKRRRPEPLNAAAVSPATHAVAPPSGDELDSPEALMSPRAAEFTASPFHRTAAGDLAGSSFFERGVRQLRVSSRPPALVVAEARESLSEAELVPPERRESVAHDPRSPHVLGLEPITRSIDDVVDG